MRSAASGPDEIERSGVAARDLAHLYAAVSSTMFCRRADVARSAVRAIGAHGQTVRHRPQLGFSVQLNAPALLAELSAIDVVADFRSRDIAAGGHGAPLASLFHIAAFSGASPRAVINVGGISNLTGLPKQRRRGTVVGFDIGPGNLLLDHLAHRDTSDCRLIVTVRSQRPPEPIKHLLECVARRAIFRRAATEKQWT